MIYLCRYHYERETVSKKVLLRVTPGTPTDPGGCDRQPLFFNQTAARLSGKHVETKSTSLNIDPVLMGLDGPEVALYLEKTRDWHLCLQKKTSCPLVDLALFPMDWVWRALQPRPSFLSLSASVEVPVWPWQHCL